MYEKFATWAEVLDHVRSAGRAVYQAPLDVGVRFVTATVRGSRVRVTGTKSFGSFWADEGHLDRFRRSAG